MLITEKLNRLNFNRARLPQWGFNFNEVQVGLGVSH
jgi:hypothetical protein